MAGTDPRLVDIWREVLQLDNVDPDGNFFDLGGDSVAAVRICARAGEAGIRLAVADILTHQTLAAIGTAAAAPAPGGPR